MCIHVCEGKSGPWAGARTMSAGAAAAPGSAYIRATALISMGITAQDAPTHPAYKFKPTPTYTHKHTHIHTTQTRNQAVAVSHSVCD
jgi:hypothetical protein